MKESHRGLYNELIKNVSGSSLKEISIEVINRYKRRDRRFIASLAESIGISSAGLEMSSLFSRIIQLYHPDKLSRITADIEEYYSTGDTAALLRMKNIYLVDLKRNIAIPDYAFDDENEYIFDEAGGDYEEFSEFDEFYGGDEKGADPDDEFFDEDEGDEYGFIEAVNDLYLGNLDYELSVSDLQNLEGELDLSGFDIDDLEGAQYCINITRLNLSGNRLVKTVPLSALKGLEALYLSENCIDDISALASLESLAELDISFNQVEDISVLLELPALAYVNLIGNPVKTQDVIEKLGARGVIVIAS